MARTAKYYRENLKKNPSEELLKEIVVKYGDGGQDIYLADVEFNSNHCIKGLSLDDGKLYFYIYWEGDSTDGDATVLVSDVRDGKAFIPAVQEVFGQHPSELHGDIHVSRKEYDNAIKALIEYLSPKAIKERNALELTRKALPIISGELLPKYRVINKWWCAAYWMAKEKTRDYVKEHAAELFKLSDSDFHDLVVKIFDEKYQQGYNASDIPEFVELEL